MLQKNGFTLAEILITLGIIGVVAVITVPTLVTSIQTNEILRRQQLFSARVDEAMNQMRVREKLTDYSSADEFVDELSKYMKISERCDADNLEQCFKFPIVSGEEKFDSSSLKTGDKITSSAMPSSYDTDNVGVIFADGTTAIINYDKSAVWLDPYETERRNSESTLPIATASQGISMIFDVNGFKGDSTVGNDISMHNAFLAVDEIGVAIVSYSAIDTCTGESDSICSSNYYAGAVAACEAIGMHVPSKSEFDAYVDILKDESDLPDSIDGVSQDVYRANFGYNNYFWLSDSYSGETSISTSDADSSPIETYSSHVVPDLSSWPEGYLGYVYYFGDFVITSTTVGNVTESYIYVRSMGATFTDVAGGIIGMRPSLMCFE